MKYGLVVLTVACYLFLVSSFASLAEKLCVLCGLIL